MNSSASVSEYSGDLVSTPRTQYPRSFKYETRWSPMKPPAPVTSTRGSLVMAFLLRLVARVGEDCGDREQEDLEIASERDALRVFDVEIGVLEHRSAAARGD